MPTEAAPTSFGGFIDMVLDDDHHARLGDDDITSVRGDATSKVELMIDLFDTSSGTFDAMLYMQCLQYLDRHEVEHLVASNLAASETIPDDEWQAMNFGERVTATFEQPLRTRLGKFILGLQAVFVFVTIVGIICESLPWWNPDVEPTQADAWLALDGVVSIYFLSELVIRLVCYPPPRRRFIFSLSVIFDFVSVLPFFVEIAVSQESRATLGMLKALRLVRLAKLVRHISTFQNLWIALRKSLPSLVAPSIFLAIVSLLLSAGIYFAERGSYSRERLVFHNTPSLCRDSSGAQLGRVECTKEESRFFSILHTMWFTITTMTSVGYGDMHPKKTMGMVLSALAMTVGSLFLAMPIAIIGSYYTVIVEENKRVKSSLNARIDSLRSNSETNGFAPGSADRRATATLYELPRALNAGKTSPSSTDSPRSADDLLSPAEKLLTFVQRNVSSRALRVVRPDAPTPALSFFTNLFLMDFVQEFARLPSNGVPFRFATGELRHTSTDSTAGERIVLQRVRDVHVPVKYFEQQVVATRPPEQLAALMEKEAAGVISPTERMQLMIAKDKNDVSLNGNFRMTSKTVGAIRISYKADLRVTSATGCDMFAEPGISEGTSSTRSRGLVGDAQPNAFVSFADRLVCSIVNKDCEQYISGHQSAASRNHTQISVSSGRAYHNSIDLTDETAFTAPRRVFPDNIIEFPLHGALPALQQSQQHSVDSKDCVRFVFQDDIEDIRRAVLSFKCALVIQRREFATLGSALGLIGLRGDEGLNPSRAVLLAEEIELLELCEERRYAASGDSMAERRCDDEEPAANDSAERGSVVTRYTSLFGTQQQRVGKRVRRYNSKISL